MNPETLGVALLIAALVVIPASRLSEVMLVWFSRKLGVKPGDIRKYDDATTDGDSGNENE